MNRQPWKVPFIIFAASTVVAIGAISLYLLHRQQIGDERQHAADVRAENQRAAICALLRTPSVPGQPVPPSLPNLRLAFARPGHPHDCEPPPTPKPSPTPSPRTVTRTEVLVVPQASAGATSPRPRQSRSPSPKPAPKPTPSPSPSSHVCIAVPLHQPVCLT